ncbi:MAG: hypothetical protein ABIH29_01420 [Candidatus Micrarchaeota archaeon]
MAAPPQPRGIQCTVAIQEMNAQEASRAMANPLQREGERISVRLVVPARTGYLSAEIPAQAVNEVLDWASHIQSPQDRRDFISQWLSDNIARIRRAHDGAARDATAFDFSVVPVREVRIVRSIEDIVPSLTFDPTAIAALVARDGQVAVASRDTRIFSERRQALTTLGRGIGRLLRLHQRTSGGLNQDQIRLLIGQVPVDQIETLLRPLGLERRDSAALQELLAGGQRTTAGDVVMVPGIIVRINQLMMDEPERDRISPVTLDRRAADEARERMTELRRIGSAEGRALATSIERAIGTVRRPQLLSLIEDADRLISAAGSRDEAAEVAAVRQASEPARTAASRLRELARDTRVGNLMASATVAALSIQQELGREAPRSSRLRQLTTEAQLLITRMEAAIASAEEAAGRQALLTERRGIAQARIATIDGLQSQDGVTPAHRRSAAALLSQLRAAREGTDAALLQRRVAEADTLIALLRADIDRHAARAPPAAPTGTLRQPTAVAAEHSQLLQEFARLLHRRTDFYSRRRENPIVLHLANLSETYRVDAGDVLYDGGVREASLDYEGQTFRYLTFITAADVRQVYRGLPERYRTAARDARFRPAGASALSMLALPSARQGASPTVDGELLEQIRTRLTTQYLAQARRALEAAGLNMGTRIQLEGGAERTIGQIVQDQVTEAVRGVLQDITTVTTIRMEP